MVQSDLMLSSDFPSGRVSKRNDLSLEPADASVSNTDVIWQLQTQHL